MIIKNAKLAFRSLLKNKTVSILNLTGLTVGVTVSLLIFIFVMKEQSTDQFIPQVEDVYCLTNNNSTYLSQNMVNLVKDEIPEVDKVTYCTVDWSPQIFLERDNQSFKVNKMLTADSCFFRVFQFEPVWGDPGKAINSTNKVVLTRSLSQRIFGDENPVGKTVTYNATYLQNEEVEVGAVIEDFPQNSSWDFDVVLSFQTNYKIDWYVDNMQHWGTQNYKGFVRINNNASVRYVSNKLENISLDKVPDDFKKEISFSLFPFNRVYFHLPELTMLKHGDPLTLSIIGITGVLILLLACINYINMVTAQREKRYKNVGIFKTMGSSRRRIIQQVTIESGLLLVISIAVSVVLVIASLDWINHLTNSGFTVRNMLEPEYVVLPLGMLVVMLILTGVIPGYIFSKKSPTLLLKKQVSGKKSNLFRNGLLVFQFSVSIALIAAILLINRQNSYMQEQDAGFAKDNIVYFNINDDVRENIEALKNELNNIPEIIDFTFSENVLVHNDQNWGREFINKGEKYDISFSKLAVTPNFFDFFGIELTEGKGFNEHSKEKWDLVLNETVKQQYNLQNIGDARMITSDPGEGRIIGVAEDIHFESLHVPVRSAIYMCSGDCDEVLYLKINAGNFANFQKTINKVGATWRELSPNFPMEHHFLDQSWEALYAKDRQFQKILLYATLISILLSCFGLLGLTYFVMERRTKEIGVRKVNGASEMEILTLLNKDFLKWVALAFTIATPVAWYTMDRWLQNFAYKVEISWWLFALSGLLSLGIALLTVSWQSWRAATRNPVEALRDE
ncbi:ABC transporter permease [Marinilabilia rubra]|uniref:ABC transporter permease n=1 Tax=Marinilabilia rubra TaxID=2162893 RepID=A0A2U2BCU4_9BACT|nr:ABC transporter permease [Marinilabilia rubra]PWE00853.1 hypothetical protein DDZ16_04475 [Marinilabilia rubra]